MFYRPQDGHGLPRNPFTAIVSPRPIGWVSTTGPMGDNLAPYSFFNAVAYVPLQVMFASNGVKDSVRNIRDTGVFCVNIVGEDQFHQMSETSAEVPREVDEFALAGLPREACRTIACPRVSGAPAALECRAVREVVLDGPDNLVVFGMVTGIHIRDDCLVNGRLDVTRYRPVARLGYQDYAMVREVVTLKRPDET
jgi:flavin reductase (DIM6/NTAB) family NADH-FMN oxidoreductase RutF